MPNGFYGGQLAPAVKTATKVASSGVMNAATGGISGVLGAGMSMIQNAVNRRWSERQADKAYERQVEQWRRENAYNSPTAMVARLKAAGLNVNDAFTGQGAQPAGGLSSVQPGANPGYVDVAGAASAMIGAGSGRLGTLSSVERNRYLNAVSKANVESLKSQVENLGADTQYKTILLKYLDRSESLRLDNEIAALNLTRQQQAYIAEQTKYYGDRIQAAIAQDYASAASLRKNVEYLDNLIQQGIQNIAESLQRQGLTEKQANWYAYNAIMNSIAGIANSAANVIGSVRGFSQSSPLNYYSLTPDYTYGNTLTQ